MRTLFINCSMGAAGDMLSAALLELCDEKETALNELNRFGIPDTRYVAEPTTKSGILGTKIRVLVKGHEEGEEHEHNHHAHHSHNNLKSIENIINSTSAPDRVKAKAAAVYRLIAEAESHVHGTTVSEIHFHEVGTLDAIADILAFCYLIDKLNVEHIIASPVNVGKGSVVCAHGILPVPAPATAKLLEGVPVYSNDVEGELCTPTGAALLKAFVDSFCEMPEMSVLKIGYGMGTKDFETANCVRMFLADVDEHVTEISFNIDDMTAEEIAFGIEELRNAGAKEVFAVPADMKKNRLGTLVTLLCEPDEKERMIDLIFRHFSTIGIRETLSRRYTMKRSVSEVQTKFGIMRIKQSEGYGYKKSKYEYDDLAKAARENNCTIREIIKDLENGE